MKRCLGLDDKIDARGIRLDVCFYPMNFAGELAVVLIVTLTPAWSVAFTLAPFGGLPDATAILVKFLFTAFRVQL